MELDIVIIVLSLLAVSIPTFLMLACRHDMRRKLPPGNMGLPWIGETAHFYRAHRSNRLYEDFLQPRTSEHGNIFKTRIMGEPMVVVSGVEANRFFLRNEFKLVVSSWPASSVQLMGKHSIMATVSDSHHRWLRGVFVSCLTGAGALEGLAPKVFSSISAYLDRHWHGRNSICLFPSLKRLVFAVGCECLLGMDPEPGLFEVFERVLCGVFSAAVDVPGSRFWRAKRARSELGRKLSEVVRKRRREMDGEVGGGGEGTLLGSLVMRLIRGEMSEEEVTDNAVLMIFAAHDTTALVLAMMCRMAAQHPDCHARLKQEHDEIMISKRGGESLTWEDVQQMKYTWRVACESMRLYPPVFGSFRKALVDIQYQGFTIPKGWKVLWTTDGTHRDPRHFPEPERFDPSRFEEGHQLHPPYAFLPFGGGTRMCAGYQFAKLNILVFMHLMVTRYNWSLVFPHEPIKIDPLPFPSFGMPIHLTPRRL